MPTWITNQELKVRKGTARVERLASPGGALDEGLITRAVEAATSDARGYLLPRYRGHLPEGSANVPEALKSHLADLALWHLVATHEVVEEEITSRHSRAVSWLRDVARGAFDLDLEAAPTVDDTTPQVLIAKPPEAAVFANGGLRDWKI